MLKATSSRFRLKIFRNADSARALGQFDRKLADLAVLRSDAKIPPRARSIAILEHDVLMLISPGDKKIKSLAELKKKKVALITSGNNLAFVRNVLDMAEGTDASSRLQLAPPNSTLDKLFASGGYGAVIAVDHVSAIVKDKNFEQIAKRAPFTVNAIDEAKALSRRHPGILEETLATGLLSSTPQIPDDDLDTVGLQWLLVGQATMPSNTAGEFACMFFVFLAVLVFVVG